MRITTFNCCLPYSEDKVICAVLVSTSMTNLRPEIFMKIAWVSILTTNAQCWELLRVNFFVGDPGKSGCAITPNSKIMGTVEGKFLWGTQESQVVQSPQIPKSCKFFLLTSIMSPHPCSIYTESLVPRPPTHAVWERH